MAKKMSTMCRITAILVIIGALNWGFIGILGMDILGMLGAGLSRILYVLIGLSGLYMIYMMSTHKK